MVVLWCLAWEHASPEGVLVPGAQLEERDGQAPPDHGSGAAWTTSTWRAGSSTPRYPCRRRARSRGWFRRRRPPAPSNRRCPRGGCASRSLGTRGIPASYGGFETFAEELSTRLAARGHQVTVYCRGPRAESTYRGVRLISLPTIRHKYFDTLAHTFLSTLHLLLHRPDVALYCNGANALFTLLVRAAEIPVALNVDGIERKRKKWNRLAQAWYYVSEWLATFCPTCRGDGRGGHPGILFARSGARRPPSSRTARKRARSAPPIRCGRSAWSRGGIFFT